MVRLCCNGLHCFVTSWGVVEQVIEAWVSWSFNLNSLDGPMNYYAAGCGEAFVEANSFHDDRSYEVS